ncbi:hypothetical protein PIB30_062408 [Stylosanthes scabra]|uniref:Uncharacterized protein n=1 Tax=Stylosanthes scabra TaxID=79078 RepID=A0ABU6SM05_9FABA|nr:hypothetical protein [Stylosanthes scabra]
MPKENHPSPTHVLPLVPSFKEPVVVSPSISSVVDFYFLQHSSQRAQQRHPLFPLSMLSSDKKGCCTSAGDKEAATMATLLLAAVEITILEVPELGLIIFLSQFRDYRARKWCKPIPGLQSPELDSEFYLRQPLCCCAPHIPITPSFLYSHFTPETINLGDFVVVTLYPNGEMGRDSGGIWFRSATPVVF